MMWPTEILVGTLSSLKKRKWSTRIWCLTSQQEPWHHKSKSGSRLQHCLHVICSPMMHFGTSSHNVWNGELVIEWFCEASLDCDSQRTKKSDCCEQFQTFHPKSWLFLLGEKITAHRKKPSRCLYSIFFLHGHSSHWLALNRMSVNSPKYYYSHSSLAFKDLLILFSDLAFLKLWPTWNYFFGQRWYEHAMNMNIQATKLPPVTQ